MKRNFLSSFTNVLRKIRGLPFTRTIQVEPDDLRRITAAHEAAHAVMRSFRGVPPTRMKIDSRGNGLTEGTGREIDGESLLLITLAGPVWELIHLGIDPKSLDVGTTKSGDIEEALRILEGSHYFRLSITICQDGTCHTEEQAAGVALLRWVAKAEEILLSHRLAIEFLAQHLVREGKLSARQVSDTLRAVGLSHDD